MSKNYHTNVRASHAPQFELDSERREIRLRGSWRAERLGEIENRLRRHRWPEGGRWILHSTEVQALDTTGAALLRHLLEQVRRCGGEIQLGNVPAAHAGLLQLVERLDRPTPPLQRRLRALQRLGQRTVQGIANSWSFLDFIGRFTLDMLPRLMRPWRLRWRQIAKEVERAGATALPIVGLLSFLMGIVIAYQGGIPLDEYGANIFIVELVAITMLREMSPLLTAIVVAGRTGSAYAAQLGTMKITEEIDALRTMGITPFEMLVLPKFLALLVALPLLTVFADILGLLGGALVADAMFGIGPAIFLERIPQELSPSNFWVGIAKAPVFAMLITLIGCYQGFQVGGSAEAVGRATTTSVVQSIFLVITADALFSIAFNLAGL